MSLLVKTLMRIGIAGDEKSWSDKYNERCYGGMSRGFKGVKLLG